jgi:hypothetical protein
MQNVATITCRKPCRKKGVRYTDVTDDILNHQGERVSRVAWVRVERTSAMAPWTWSDDASIALKPSSWGQR